MNHPHNNNKIFALVVFLVMLVAGGAQQAQASTSAEAAPQGIFTVSLADAEHAVARALEREGAADIVAADITSTRLGTLYRQGQAIGIDVNTLKFDDPKAGAFSANLYFMKGEDVMSVLPVSGRYEEMIPVPVVRQRLTNSETIEEADLDEVLYPASRLRKGMALSAAEVIGKSPVRIISKGRPIRLGELKAPAILQKGDKVQMRYRTKYMVISTLGEALQDGAQGENIRVRNFESGAVVQAHVASGSEVIVGGTPSLIE